ncbi:sensor histidine kinase [Cellvibrio sp.]|uniref:sensor histidine kinase n=1 Tax=Cellvibrio sp. TaxID=1965322 RepID=UPI0039648B16
MKNIKIEHLLLTLAGLSTWALVAAVELSALKEFRHWYWMACGYLVFILLLLPISTGRLHRVDPRVGKVFLSVQLVLVFVILFAHPWVLAPVLLVIWAGCLPEFFTRRQSIALVLISSLMFGLSSRLDWHGFSSLITALSYFGFQFFALTSSFARVSERHARENVEQLNQKLLATRNLLAQSSRQEERVRIARDLHDVLGHQLTALNLQLEILQHKAPDELRESVQQSKSLAKSLLENIRQVVRDQRHLLSLDIRQAVWALLVHIPQLQVNIEGELQLDSVQLAEQIVFCIQEGISNALRHGGATRINLTLEQQACAINIFLEDDGRGLVAGSHNGTGLEGMRERLAPYGGSVELSKLAQGCRLAISLTTASNNGCKDLPND